MGAWNFGSFDNDDAADWLYELEESSDTSVLAATLETVTEIGDEYLEAPDCSSGLAAAEIVAALRGHPLNDLPDNAKAWVAAHSSLDVSSLVPVAQAAVQRIRNGSELKELWEESGDASEWYASLNDLSARLSRQ